jgi:chlorobactene glucosyltransferase
MLAQKFENLLDAVFDTWTGSLSAADLFLLSLLSVHVLLTVWVMYNARQWPRAAHASTASSEEPHLHTTTASSEEPHLHTTTTVRATSLPFVSILVPARNEQRGLERCLVSLLEQDYPYFEVICLDDRSEDLTPRILDQLQLRYPHLQRTYGAELPSGWIGKCHACHQLSQSAQGELYLFTDADTVHQANMLRSMVTTLHAQQAALLTGFPQVLTHHAMGWLILPLLFFVIVLHLPLRYVATSLNPRLIAAHGAFMLFRAEAYHAIGGHLAHRQAIVEDMEMAKAIKKTKRKAYLVDITPYVACDMYEKPRDVWQGFSKNMFLGLGASTVLLFGLLSFYTVVYVFPLFGSFAALSTQRITASVILFVCYLLSCLQKFIVDRRFGTRGAWFWFIPFSFIGLISIAMCSWYLYVTKQGYTWKGRVYRR